MKTLISKVCRILTPQEQFRLGLLLILNLGNTCVELLGIGAIVPFIAVLTQPDIVHQNEYIALLYQWINPASFTEFILWMGGGMAFLYLSKNVYLLSYLYLQTRFVNQVYARLVSKLFKSYLFKPYRFHLEKNSAQLLRNINLAKSTAVSVMMPLLSLVTELTIITAILILLLWTNPIPSTVMSLALAAFVGIFYKVVHSKLTLFGKRQMHHSSKMIQDVQQGLGGIKETKILGRESFFNRSYHFHTQEFVKATQYQQIIAISPRHYIEVVVVSTIVFMMMFFLNQGHSPESVLIFLSLFAVAGLRLMPSVSKVSLAIASLRFYTPSLEEVYEDLIEHALSPFTPLLPEATDSSTIGFQKSIDVKNLSFQYTEESSPALQLINLSIPKASSVGFVGESGAGKTTIVDVILGLLTPSSGGVFVDGKDIQQHLSSWQQHIGYIPQNIYLTDSSIKENVAFGMEASEVSEEQVWKALEMAQLKSFVESLEDGLDTSVGEHGARLSGGQQQRIGIARALYHDPDVLVMDEATAALDNQTEHAFMKSIQALSGQKTLIFIAHRLTTVERCDQIYFMKQGSVADQGSYSELLERNADFREMAMKS